MALDIQILEDGFLDILQNPPQNIDEYIDRVCENFHQYASAVIPASSTSNAALQAMKSIMPVAPRMENVYRTYVNILATGMITSNFNGTPPPSLLVFDSLLPLGLSGQQEQSALGMAHIIHTWMKTGLATLIPSPHTTVNWS